MQKEYLKPKKLHFPNNISYSLYLSCFKITKGKKRNSNYTTEYFIAFRTRLHAK